MSKQAKFVVKLDMKDNETKEEFSVKCYIREDDEIKLYGKDLSELTDTQRESLADVVFALALEIKDSL